MIYDGLFVVIRAQKITCCRSRMHPECLGTFPNDKQWNRRGSNVNAGQWANGMLQLTRNLPESTGSGSCPQPGTATVLLKRNIWIKLCRPGVWRFPQTCSSQSSQEEEFGGAKVCKKKRSGGAKVCRKEKVGQCLPLLLSRMVTPPLHQITVRYMSDSDYPKERIVFDDRKKTCILIVSPTQMRSDESM